MPGALIVPGLTLEKPAPERAADPRRAMAEPRFGRFLVLIAQLALLLGVFRVFRVQEFYQVHSQDSTFFPACCLMFGAFAVHYWLPFHLKERFWIAVCLVGAGMFFPLRVIVALIGLGTVFYLILRSRLAYWFRVGLIVCIFLSVMEASVSPVLVSRIFGRYGPPSTLWPIFGSIFMFRLIIYAHDVRYMKGRPSLQEYLAYFFILPNYYFWLFPVIDFQAMRLGYYRRNIDEVAQQGIAWICRGTLQLLLYEVVSSQRNLQVLRGVSSLGSLVWFLLLTFLLYLRVSGQFHIIAGLLHLFGYDLPETNHKYLLSRSLMDFWRRINIYWRDFMVKIVYFPIYFRLRKRNELRAQVLATTAVFVVTWALHSYQAFWLRGAFVFTWPDTIFWAILGAAVVASVWRDARKPGRPAATGWRGRATNAISVLATGLFIISIWSLWSAPSVSAWLDLMRWWRPAP